MFSAALGPLRKTADGRHFRPLRSLPTSLECTGGRASRACRARNQGGLRGSLTAERMLGSVVVPKRLYCRPPFRQAGGRGQLTGATYGSYAGTKLRKRFICDRLRQRSVHTVVSPGERFLLLRLLLQLKLLAALSESVWNSRYS